jgi:NADH-quinone oxidoreductase subunit H
VVRVTPLSTALGILITVVVYPGLLFLVVLGLLSQWYRRKLVARIQNRVGPKYVGPFGILQPFADVYKLLFVKEVVTGVYTPIRLLMFLTALGIAATSSATALLPMTPYYLRAPLDVFVFIYLTLYASIAVAVLGLGSTSPYPSFGGARYTALMLVFEPAIAMSLIALVRVLAPDSLSIAEALSNPRIPLDNPLRGLVAVATVVIATVAYTTSLLAKAMLKPFDIPEAETEVAGGYLAELSGPALGLSILLHEVELTLYVLVLANLVIPVPPLEPGALPTAIALVKYFAVLTVLVVVAYSMGRVRVDQALRTLSKYSLTLSVIALVASFLT